MEYKIDGQLTTWKEIAHFFGVSIKTCMTWRDTMPRFKKLLRIEMRKVVLKIPDAKRFKESLCGAYSKLAPSQKRRRVSA